MIVKRALSFLLFLYVAWLFLPLVNEGVAGAVVAGVFLFLFMPGQPER